MASSRGAGRRTNEGAVTLREVAEKAGVHPGTVSRALQGDERVAPATLQHIQRIARELNYTPNIAARVLAMGKTETIAIATGSPFEHYYARILHFLEKELIASNYKRLILSGWDLKRDLLSIVNTHSVDGVLAIDAFPHVDDLIHSAELPMLPCVYAGVAHVSWTAWASVDIVKIDLSGAVRQAIQAMVDGGCRRVAYLLHDSNMASTDEVRAHIYTTTLNEIGMKHEIIDLATDYGEKMPDQLPGRLKEYIRQQGCPDGLLCQNDEVAILAQRVLKDLGLRIPDDVQIVGCDGLPYMKYFDPPLSTIEQPAEEMCAIAWQFLQRRINEPSLPQQQATLNAQLRVRPSLKIAGR